MKCCVPIIRKIILSNQGKCVSAALISDDRLYLRERVMPLKYGPQQGTFALKIVVEQPLGYFGFGGQVFETDVFDASLGE